MTTTRQRRIGGGKPGRVLSARDRELCAKCKSPRWYHYQTEGLVPDHPFVERGDANKYLVKIQAAEHDLGRLAHGERVDLLLDNFEELPGADEARAIVKALEQEHALRNLNCRCSRGGNASTCECNGGRL